MSNTTKDEVRLEKAIYAKLRLEQAKIELRRAQWELEGLLTVAEAKGRFNSEAASKTMLRIKNRADIDIVKSTHCGNKLNYKDVGIYLHDSRKLGRASLESIFKE